MRSRDVILLTGMSGAGKSTALLAFEELGYRCIDNPPADLYTALFELVHHEANAIKTVISVNLLNAKRAIEKARHIEGLHLHVICLVASLPDILSRYKLTRHLHPLQAEGYTLAKAIDTDLSLVEAIRPDVNDLVDTTGMKVSFFKEKLFSLFRHTPEKVMTVSLVSFGFKHGLPMDADMVMDVRVLDNPFHHETLRSLSGLDTKIIDFVQQQTMFQTLIHQVQTNLQGYLDVVIQQGRHYYEFSVGCTGGRHRSVVFVETLAKALRNDPRLDVLVYHRDIDKFMNQE